MGISASLRLRTLSACCGSSLALLAASWVTAPDAGARIARDSGGSGLGGTTTSSSGTTSATTTTPAPATAEVVPLTGTQQVEGGGITLTVAQFGELRHVLEITGSAPLPDAGETIEIEGTSAPGGADDSGWSELASATIAANGSFSAVWIPSTSAAFTLQATLLPGLDQTPSPTGGGALPDAADAAAALTATETFMLPVFNPSRASFYGPGFWGRRTACGEVLRRSTLGVANRTLPCGTMVAVYFGGRELSVPVIDRGPYANHANWDLTYAAAKALHITQTAQVGTLAPAPASLSAAVRHGG